MPVSVLGYMHVLCGYIKYHTGPVNYFLRTEVVDNFPPEPEGRGRKIVKLFSSKKINQEIKIKNQQNKKSRNQESINQEIDQEIKQENYQFRPSRKVDGGKLSTTEVLKK